MGPPKRDRKKQFEQFINRAAAIVSDLNDGYTKTRDIIRSVRELETLRQSVFCDAANEPGCDFKRYDDAYGGAYKFGVRHPRLDDRRVAWIFDDYTLSDDDEAELRGMITRTLNAWIVEATQQRDTPQRGREKDPMTAKIQKSILPNMTTEQVQELVTRTTGKRPNASAARKLKSRANKQRHK